MNQNFSALVNHVRQVEIRLSKAAMKTSFWMGFEKFGGLEVPLGDLRLAGHTDEAIIEHQLIVISVVTGLAAFPRVRLVHQRWHLARRAREDGTSRADAPAPEEGTVLNDHLARAADPAIPLDIEVLALGACGGRSNAAGSGHLAGRISRVNELDLTRGAAARFALALPFPDVSRSLVDANKLDQWGTEFSDDAAAHCLEAVVGEDGDLSHVARQRGRSGLRNKDRRFPLARGPLIDGLVAAAQERKNKQHMRPVRMKVHVGLR